MSEETAKLRSLFFRLYAGVKKNLCKFVNQNLMT